MDANHSNRTQLYSLFERQYANNKIDAFHSTPGLMAEEMKRVFPDVQYASGFGWINKNTFELEEKVIKEEGSYAGPDFFKMFSYPLLQGNAATALSSPSSIAVSRNMAVHFFGSQEQAMNKTIRFQDARDFKITAVFENTGNHDSRKFDYLINWEAFLEDNQWLKNWNIIINDGPRTYIQLRPGTNAVAFENKIKHFMDGYFKMQPSGFKIELGIQRFDKMFLYSRFKNGQVDGGRIEYIRLFLIIAGFILLIACVNFMNLTTARFTRRAKEVGIRKVAGAVRFALIKQFIGESVLFSFLAALVSLGLVSLALPSFNILTHKEIELPFKQLYFPVVIVLLFIFTGFLAGSYPALFLSSFSPVKVLKGSIKTGPGVSIFRKGLVIFQFALSIILIIATIIVSQQVDYVQKKNLGYNKENIISVPLEGNLTDRNNYNTFKNQALNIPGVKFISRITGNLVNTGSGTYDVSWDKKQPNEKKLFIHAATGYDFVKTLNLQMKEGRDFSRDFPTDTSGYILNEAAVEQIGYKNPIGRLITFWGGKGPIIGVVKNFHFASLHDPIRPLIIRFEETDTWGNALVKMDAGSTAQVLKSLGSLSTQLNPKFQFSFQFLDEANLNLYTSERIIGKLSSYFAFLAILISCMGLFGLSMFTAEQRTKEIGIRKVAGATVLDIVSLLSKDFIKLVMIAFVFACPIAWFSMNRWLSDFAYRINISWWIFLVAALLIIAISLLTVSFQSVKAALANPVKSLRME